MSIREQLLAVGAWLRSRYEDAPAMELPMLAAVIAYLEALADLETAAIPIGDDEESPATGYEAEGPVAVRDESVTVSPADFAGTFMETPSGGTVTPDGHDPIDVPWNVVYAAGLSHGDRVRIAPKPGQPNRFVFTRTGATVSVGASGVSETVVALKDRRGILVADIDGKRVRVVPAYAKLQDLAAGSVVTVRYNTVDLDCRNARAYAIRLHQDGGPAEEHAPDLTRVAHPKRRRIRRRQITQAALGSSKTQDSPAAKARKEMLSTLPEILVLGGHTRNFEHYRRALAEHAKVRCDEGTRLSKSLRTRVSNAVGVVVVVQRMSHPVSDYVQAEAKRKRIPYIVAQSENAAGLAKQVMRELLPRLVARPHSA